MAYLSVIMSVYNGERFLKESIDSILNQSFKDFEFIIIDDCSTDKSLEILNQYSLKDDRIKIIQKDQNIGIKGFIENLNIGISKAEGKYIARMDQDDISHLGRFQQQIDFLDANPNVFMVGAQLNLMNESNKIIGEKIGAIEHDEIVAKIEKQIQLFHPVIMFRKSKTIQYREKFLYCEDYDLYLNVITADKKLANLPEKLLDYRILDSSISRRGNVFVKRLMVEKALYFYRQRNYKGVDDYDDFNNQEIFEILNFDFKNSKEELIFAINAAIKLNNKTMLKLLIKKHQLQYPKDKIDLKYQVYSNLPVLFYRILNKF